MASFFYTPVEKRYVQFPRRYLVEYHHDGRRIKPSAKGSCATLASSRQRAVRAIEMEWCTVVRVFDRKIGQYLFTYKRSVAGITRHEGNVK